MGEEFVVPEIIHTPWIVAGNSKGEGGRGQRLKCSRASRLMSKTFSRG